MSVADRMAMQSRHRSPPNEKLGVCKPKSGASREGKAQSKPTCGAGASPSHQPITRTRHPNCKNTSQSTRFLEKPPRTRIRALASECDSSACSVCTKSPKWVQINRESFASTTCVRGISGERAIARARSRVFLKAPSCGVVTNCTRGRDERTERYGCQWAAKRNGSLNSQS